MAHVTLESFIGYPLLGGTLLQVDYNTFNGLGLQARITSATITDGRFRITTSQLAFNLVARVAGVHVAQTMHGIYIICPGWQPPTSPYLVVENGVAVPASYSDSIRARPNL